MSTGPPEIDAARSLVANAISVAIDRIAPETRMYDLSVWDSFGQLSVILAIEETLHIQIADESVFDSLTSVRGIAAYLSSVPAEQCYGRVQDTGRLAPYYPTPERVVAKMLELGELKSGEKMFDLGSGDGRIVIVAAQRFHAYATGVELDKSLVELSNEKIGKLRLEKNARILTGDLLRQDYTSADLITVYLLPLPNHKVQSLLDRELKKGARVVAHDFEFRGWMPAKVETIDDDGEGRSHKLFLYRK